MSQNSAKGGGSVIGTAGGDLSGSYPNPTVAKANGATIPASGSLTTGNVLQVSGSATLTYGPINLAGGSNYVTGTLPVGNQAAQTLAGDATGTTAAVVVVKIQGNAAKSGTLGSAHDGYVFTWNNSNSRWEETKYAGDVTGKPSVSVVEKINGATVPIAGSLTTGNGLYVSGSSALSYSALNLAGGAGYVTGVLPVGNQAAQTMIGDVSGTTAASQVDKIKTKALATALSSIGSLQDGYVLTWVNGSSEWQAKPTATAITFAGDLSGNSSTQTVEKIKGTTITTAGGSLAVGAVLRTTAAGTADWGQVNLADTDAVTGVLPEANQADQTMGGDVTGATSTSTVVKIQNRNVNSTAPTDGQILTWDNDDGYWKPADAPIGFTAGCDLSGSNTCQTVVAIQNNPVDNTSLGPIHDGYVLTWVDASSEWQAIPTTGGPPSGSAGGDLSGSYPNPDVVKIRTKSLASSLASIGAGENNYVLTWVNGSSEWQALPTQGVVTFAGDLTGNTSSQTVVAIQGNPAEAVTYGPSEDGYFFSWNDTAGEWQAVPPPSGTFSAGGDLSGTETDQTVIAIQGNSVNNTSLGATQDGYVLTWVNGSSEWQAKPAVDTGVTTVGTIDTSPNANGLYISGTTISTQLASASNIGMVSTTTQTLAGVKTFSSQIIAGTSSTYNTLTGGLLTSINTVAGNLTLPDGYYAVLVDTNAARSLTLPSPSVVGRTYIIKDKSGLAETNNITIVRNGSEKIDGVAASRILSANSGTWKFVSDGTDWWILT